MHIKVEAESPEGIAIKEIQDLVWSFSSLRATDARTDYDFFKQLSDMIVINIDMLSAQEKDGVSLSALKSYMFINFKILTNAIKVLHSKHLVVLCRCSGTESSDPITPDSIILKLTNEGSKYVRSILYAKYTRLDIG